MRYALTLISCLLLANLQAQNVQFSDASLKALLISQLCVDTNGDTFGDSDVDFNNDGEIQVSEALSVETLFLNDYNAPLPVLSVSDLSNFENLKRLTIIHFDGMVSCSNIGITGLEYFHIDACLILDVIDISDMPNLTTVRIEDLASLEFLNVQNGSEATTTYSLFYTQNIASACVDDIGDEYQITTTAMLNGAVPNSGECVLSVSEEIINQPVTLFPNPTLDVLNIASAEFVQQVWVYDLGGKLLFNEFEPASSFSLEPLGAGIYIVQITTDGGDLFQKIVKN